MLPQLILLFMTYRIPYDLIFLFFQLLSVVGLIWSAKYFSSSEFGGLAQIKRYRAGNYDLDDIDENSTLRIEGPYKYSRHPVYFFSIMFLVMQRL